LTLAPLRVARGMAAPASATAPPLTRRGAACAGGWPSSPCRHPDTLRGRDPRPGSGWNSLAFARSPCASGVALGVHAGLCPPSAGKAARVKSGGGPPAFLPRRRTCRKVPRPETGRPRHARAFLFLVFRSGYNNAPQLCISTKPMPSISFMSLSGRMNDAL
jgi:hypothetical protein